MSDVKTYDKGGELVRNKGQFRFIDPTVNPIREYEPGTVYRADVGPGTWVGGQVAAGAFALVDEDGNDLGAPKPKAAKTDKPAGK